MSSISTDKILFIGDLNVGKTSLWKRYVDRNDIQNHENIGAYSASKRLTNDDIIHIWDIIEPDKLSKNPKMKKKVYSNPLAVLLIFDVNRASTFESIPKWVSEILKFNQNKIVPMALIGNKSDLRSEGSINLSGVLKYAEEISKRVKVKIPYFEISAKTEESYEKFDYFMENLEFYISFFHSFEDAVINRFFIAEKIYAIIKRNETEVGNFDDYFQYIKENANEVADELGEKLL